MKVYLDNSATTKVRDEVLEEMLIVYKDDYGNPSSLHRMGLDIEKKIDLARKRVAKLINSDVNDIIFTSGGTESNNIAIQGFIDKINKEKHNIVTTNIEHDSIGNIFKYYSQKGIDVRYLKTDSKGFITRDSIDRLVDDNTQIISIIYVNNEIGTIQNINSLIGMVRKKNKNIKIHLDAIQAFGKIVIDVKKLDIDTMSFSSHKIHGPKGVGGLYISPDINMKGLMFGGGQEKDIRSGTENTAGIIGFGKACELIYNDYNNYVFNLRNIRNSFASKIGSEIRDVKVNSLLNESSAPHILSISFEKIKAEVLLHFLENYNIFVSTGSACSSNHVGISQTLKSIGLEKKYIDGTIRFSFGYFNSIEEIDYTVDKIRYCVKEIRSVIG